MEKSIPKTLLVVKNRALGDSIMGLSTLQYLKDILPNTELIYGVPGWIHPLYKNVKTAADKVIPLDFKSFSDWRESRQAIKGFEVDTVLELFQSGRTAKFFKLWSLFGGPSYVFHNHHKKEGLVHDQGVIKSNIQRDLDAAWTFFGRGNQPPSFLGYPPSLELSTEKKNRLILGVVATRETKMWPLEYYAKLSRLLEAEDPQREMIIPLGPGDQEIEKRIEKLPFSPKAKIVKVGLSDLPKELAQAKQYIGNDTGLKHICVALGVKTFTLFGPEPPTEWHPYNREEHPLYFREPLDCRTRIAHYCGLQTCDSMICLNQLQPEALLKLINP